jgi:predicted ester cyclase
MTGTELARRFFEDVCNGRRLDVADQILSADHVYHDAQSPSLGQGHDAMKQTVALYQEGLKGRWEVKEIVDAGDRVTVRWTGHGVHHAEIMGIAPTGHEVHVDALTLLRIEGDKIAENWTSWDTLGMLQQIGAVPAPA